jgi:hypothetical protein
MGISDWFKRLKHKERKTKSNSTDKAPEEAIVVRPDINREELMNQIAVLNRADWHNRYIQAELGKGRIVHHVTKEYLFVRCFFSPAIQVSGRN